LITMLRHILSRVSTGRFPARNATQEVSTQERHRTALHATRQTTGTTDSLVRTAPSVTGPAAGREPALITTQPLTLLPGGTRKLHAYNAMREASTAARRRTAPPVTRRTTGTAGSSAKIVQNVTRPAAGREPRWITTGPPSHSQVHMQGWGVPRVTGAGYTTARRRTAQPVTKNQATMLAYLAPTVRRVTTPADGCRHGTIGGTRSTCITKTLMVPAGRATRTHWHPPAAMPATMAHPTTMISLSGLLGK
jgi:hypothetical protein